MRAISLFSGIGGLEYGFAFAGIPTVVQVENDKWCQSVLERHWPEVARVSDILEVDATAWARRCGNLVGVRSGTDAEWLGATRGWDDHAHGAGDPGAVGAGWRVETALAAGPIDLVFGGFPCQDVSVAGKRAGLSGSRSSLWFEFERVLRELRPRWCVIENVPGLLSSHRGKDFGLVLRGLADIGYGWAYRVLDARWFGVPQRRRRILVVGCLGDEQRAAQVLSVCESCGGYLAARTQPQEDLALTLDDGARRTSLDLPMTVAATLSSGGHPNSNIPARHHEDDANLILAFGGNNTSGAIDVAAARSSRGNRYDFETDTFVVAHPLRASDGHHGWSGGRGDGDDNLIADPISTREQKTWTHEGSHNFRTHNLVHGVRRLTPLECERLQGFPDGWTATTADGRPIADAHRYRMLGNAVATPVAQWLGYRLAWVDAHVS